jgi:hypothetical protein
MQNSKKLRICWIYFPTRKYGGLGPRVADRLHGRCTVDQERAHTGAHWSATDRGLRLTGARRQWLGTKMAVRRSRGAHRSTRIGGETVR